MSSADLPVGWLPLADAVAKVTLVLALAAGATLLLRRASAALRHMVWMLALASALLLPALSLALPKWQVSILPADAGARTVRAPAVDAMAPPTEAPRPSASDDSLTPRPAGPMPGARPGGMAGLHDAGGVSLPRAAFWVWLSGVCAVFARVFLGLVAVRVLRRGATEAVEAPWLPLARQLAAGMRVTPRLRFLHGARASMPIAAGVLRPVVIMPAAADGWCESRLRVVLLHELAHVKRRDCLTHLLAQIVCAAYWFNPLVWIAARRARTERERACDDLVLATGTRGSDYAGELIEIARMMRGDRFPGLLARASLAMAHRSQLEGRLVAILDPHIPRTGVSRARAVAAAVLCCGTVAPLGALQPWAPPPAAAPAVIAAPEPEPAVAIPAMAPAAPVAVQPRGPRPRPASAPGARVAVEVAAPAVAAVLPRMAEPVLAPWPIPVPDVVAGVLSGAQTPKPAPAPKPVTRAPAEKRQADPRTIAALTAALKDTDKEVRETAMHALVQLRDPSVVEPLIAALKDAAADVRAQAAVGLGQLRDRRAVQPLAALLGDENAGVREQAAFALGQLSDPAAIEALGTALGDASADVREQAAFALSQIRDRRAVGPLVSALKDESPDVREQAAFALAQIGDTAAAEALIIATKDANVDVREQVIFALGQLRDPRAIDALTAALKDASAEVRRMAAYALGQLAR